MDNQIKYVIKDSDYVTVTNMNNNIFEVQYLMKQNHLSHILKLDKDSYMIKNTGEIKEFNKINDRSESINSLKQTMKKIRYLINNNFSGGKKELWATLTFKDTEIAKNPKEIYKEFNKFMKRLNYKYKNLEYIVIIEPHGIENNNLNNWHGFHLHLLLKSKSNLYIPYDEFEKIWGLGMTRIERLNNIDNIGAYISAYLTNIEIKEEKNSGKKFIKGARIWLYPKNINIYRKSRGITFPERTKMKYKEAKELIGVPCHYRKEIQINSKDNDYENIIIFEQFNRNRR